MAKGLSLMMKATRQETGKVVKYSRQVVVVVVADDEGNTPGDWSRLPPAPVPALATVFASVSASASASASAFASVVLLG